MYNVWDIIMLLHYILVIYLLQLFRNYCGCNWQIWLWPVFVLALINNICHIHSHFLNLLRQNLIRCANYCVQVSVFFHKFLDDFQLLFSGRVHSCFNSIICYWWRKKQTFNIIINILHFQSNVIDRN